MSDDITYRLKKLAAGRYNTIGPVKLISLQNRTLSILITKMLLKHHKNLKELKEKSENKLNLKHMQTELNKKLEQNRKLILYMHLTILSYQKSLAKMFKELMNVRYQNMKLIAEKDRKLTELIRRLGLD